MNLPILRLNEIKDDGTVIAVAIGLFQIERFAPAKSGGCHITFQSGRKILAQGTLDEILGGSAPPLQVKVSPVAASAAAPTSDPEDEDDAEEEIEEDTETDSVKDGEGLSDAELAKLAADEAGAEVEDDAPQPEPETAAQKKRREREEAQAKRSEERQAKARASRSAA